MPATPAWPPHSAPRLFIDKPLACGQEIALDGPQAHYLANVMRAKAGDGVKLFDDRTGEYRGDITDVAKRRVAIAVGELLRPRENTPDLWLVAAPIKRPRFDMLCEKACELGIRQLIPVETRRGVVDKFKPDRIRATMIEAAEQCERTALPEIGAFAPLTKLLENWPADRHLFFADERGHDDAARTPFRAALRAHDGPAAILIGPEGGFTDAENVAIRACAAAVPISLGPRILRAETAGIAAIAVWMAGRGDWG